MDPQRLADGRYDAFVVWAERTDGGVLTLDLTIVSGEHKGDVLSITGGSQDSDPMALTGLPCTLVIEGGEPRIEE